MKTTKREIVYKSLKGQINSGEIAPGEKIVISEQAKKFNVSGIPIREAVNALASEGLLKLTPMAGAEVVSLTKEDVLEVYQLKVEFESLATRLAVNNLSNSHLSELTDIVDKSAACISRGDFKQYRQLNRKFHETIYLYCGNNRLRVIISDLWGSSTRYPMPFATEEQIRTSISEHYGIIEALRNRDERLVEELVREHKNRSLDEVLEDLEVHTKDNLKV